MIRYERDLLFIIAPAVAAGLIAGGIGVSGAIGTGISARGGKTGKTYRKKLKKDVAKMERGDLGLNAQQKRDAMREIVRATQDEDASLEQKLAARGQAAASIEKGSQQLGLQEEAQIVAGLEAQRRKVAGDWATAINLASGGLTTGITAGLGQAAAGQKQAVTAAGSAGPTVPVV